MNVPGASTYTDLQGLTSLKAAARENSPEALKAVARQFEAVFMQMMLKSMRDASEGDPLFDGAHSEFYRDMYDKQLALDLTERGGGMGLADMLVRQLQGMQGTGTASPLTALPIPPHRPLPVEPAAPAVSAATGPVPASDHFDSPEDFIAQLRPLAERAAQRLGVAPEALLAQAALETGWGKAVIRHPDGSSSYNLFNIKADHRWAGEQVSRQTLEYRGGVAQRETAQFRAYGSFAESFDDYTRFLESNPRYGDALQQTGNAKAFIRALQEAGYATDPDYARKISHILDRSLVAEARPMLKNPEARPLT